MRLSIMPYEYITIPLEQIFCLIVLLGLIAWFLMKIRRKWLKVTSIVLLFSVPTLAAAFWAVFMYGIWISKWDEFVSDSCFEAAQNVRVLKVIRSREKGESMDVDPFFNDKVIHNLEHHLDASLQNHSYFMNNRSSFNNRMVVFLFGDYDDSFRYAMPDVIQYRKTHPGVGVYTNYQDVLETY